MVEAKTYFKVGDQFVPTSEFAGPIEDQYYVDGALELTIDGHKLLTTDNWDLIDQLLAYLVEGLSEVSQGRRFSTNFPDCPVHVVFEPEGDMVTVTADWKSRKDKDQASAVTTREELIRVLGSEARRFFEHVLPMMPQDRQENEKLLEVLRTLGV